MALAEKAGRARGARLLDAARADGRRPRGGTCARCWPPTRPCARHLPPEELDRLFDPRRYLGAAGPLIDRVLARHAAATAASRAAGAPEPMAFVEAGDLRMRYELARPRGGAGGRALALARRGPLDVGPAAPAARAALCACCATTPAATARRSLTPGPYALAELAGDVLRLLDALARRARPLLRALDGRPDRHVARRARRLDGSTGWCSATPRRASATAETWNARIRDRA